MWDGYLVCITAAEHRIKVLESHTKRLHSAPYRGGSKTGEKEKQEIEKILNHQLMEPAHTKWNAPIIFAPKKNGTLRLCVEYWEVNADTNRDSYSIIRIDECLGALGEVASLFSLDVNFGYWQIEIEKSNSVKTAFTSHHGLYRFSVMPFGLQNAPGTIQRAMGVILTTIKWKFELVYLDFIFPCARTPDEHDHKSHRSPQTSNQRWRQAETQEVSVLH